MSLGLNPSSSAVLLVQSHFTQALPALSPSQILASLQLTPLVLKITLAFWPDLWCWRSLMCFSLAYLFSSLLGQPFMLKCETSLSWPCQLSFLLANCCFSNSLLLLALVYLSTLAVRIFCSLLSEPLYLQFRPASNEIFQCTFDFLPLTYVYIHIYRELPLTWQERGLAHYTCSRHQLQ